MADTNQKNINEKQRQFWTVPRSKNNTNSSKSSGSEKKPEPAKAPICYHHDGDCEADIPHELLQNAGVPRGRFCETNYERRLREEEEACWYDECYRPPE